MIPAFNSGGILPPHLGDPTAGIRSPYLTDVVELVQTFGTSPERRAILRGLIEYRKMLYDAGFVAGQQLLNGSFAEDCEKLRGRPPKDIDVFSYLILPEKYQKDTLLFQNEGLPFILNEALGQKNKERFKVDSYLVVQPGMPVVEFFQAFSYFLLLFSHQRGTEVWKGALSVSLDPADDAQALNLLAALEKS